MKQDKSRAKESFCRKQAGKPLCHQLEFNTPDAHLSARLPFSTMSNLDELYAEQDARWNMPDEPIEEYFARRIAESRNKFLDVLPSVALL